MLPQVWKCKMPDDPIAQRWLAKLTRLNAATGRGACRGQAPHKPLLLLALLDLAEAGELPSPALTRSPGLVLRFRSYGTIAAGRWPTRLDARMPFYHLASQGFWQPFTAQRQPATGPESCAVCELHPEFFELLADAGFRLKARMVLVTGYFQPAERVALFESLGLPAGNLPAAERLLKEAVAAAKRKGRSARFAVRIVSEYRYTCALTGYRCFSGDGTSIVDAAHIEAWTKTQNDDLGNGLALSKNAHWMFDEGLWSADDRLRVIVNLRKFDEAGPAALRLAPLAGRPLHFDPAARLRPALEYLGRHRAHHGFGLR